MSSVGAKASIRKRQMVPFLRTSLAKACHNCRHHLELMPPISTHALKKLILINSMAKKKNFVAIVIDDLHFLWATQFHFNLDFRFNYTFFYEENFEKFYKKKRNYADIARNIIMTVIAIWLDFQDFPHFQP